jgi:hypothetical protein
MMMMGDDDEMANFLHSSYSGILRARGEHKLLFALAFAFAFRTLLCSLHTLLRKNRRTQKTFAPNFRA